MQHRAARSSWINEGLLLVAPVSTYARMGPAGIAVGAPIPFLSHDGGRGLLDVEHLWFGIRHVVSPLDCLFSSLYWAYFLPIGRELVLRSLLD